MFNMSQQHKTLLHLLREGNSNLKGYRVAYEALLVCHIRRKQDEFSHFLFTVQ